MQPPSLTFDAVWPAVAGARSWELPQIRLATSFGYQLMLMRHVMNPDADPPVTYYWDDSWAATAHHADSQAQYQYCTEELGLWRAKGVEVRPVLESVFVNTPSLAPVGVLAASLWAQETADRFEAYSAAYDEWLAPRLHKRVPSWSDYRKLRRILSTKGHSLSGPLYSLEVSR